MSKAAIIKHYLATKLNQRRFKNRATLEAWQHQQVDRLLDHVLPRSPFYRQHFSHHKRSEWHIIPTVSKSDLMGNFSQWNTADIALEEAFSVALQAEKSRDFSPVIDSYSVGLSSGTSGNRGLFLVSKEERAAWAGAVLAKILPDCWKRPERIALFLRANNQLYQALDDGQWIRFRYFDMMIPIETHIEALNHYQPSILVAPPSVLRMLANAQYDKRLTIKPQKIVSAAEVLEPLDASWIEQCFEQKLHQIYQCTEGFLAATCTHGTLHLNEDIVLIEKHYLDESLGKFSPIITDFRRFTQPIIRYQLNDILTEKKEACPCGSIFAALESIEGRCDDLFYGEQSDSKLQAIFPDFIRRAVILASETIQEYCVKQLSLDSIEVSLRLSEDSTDAENAIHSQIQKELRNVFQQLNCKVPNITFTSYQTINGAKLRRIQRCFEV